MLNHGISITNQLINGKKKKGQINAVTSCDCRFLGLHHDVVMCIVIVSGICEDFRPLK